MRSFYAVVEGNEHEAYVERLVLDLEQLCDEFRDALALDVANETWVDESGRHWALGLEARKVEVVPDRLRMIDLVKALQELARRHGISVVMGVDGEDRESVGQPPEFPGEVSAPVPDKNAADTVAFLLL